MPERSHQQESSTDRLISLLALGAFAISEPILTGFGATPAAFIFHDIESLPWLLAYGLVVVCLPGLGLWLLARLAGSVSQRLGDLVYWACLLLLAVAWALQFGKWGLELQQPLAIIGLAIVIGCVFLLLYIRNPLARSVVRAAAIAPPVFLALFLFTSAAGEEFAFRPEVSDIEKRDLDVPSVVFVMLDELPTMGLLNEEELIERERFPNLAAFAERATWYRRYTIAHAKTDYSVPSVLSGQFPRSVAPTYANYPENLFTLLAPTHHLTVFESITELCALPECGRDAPGAIPQELTPRFVDLLRLTALFWQRRITPDDKGGEGVGDFQESLTAVRDSDAATGRPASLSSVPLSADARIPKRLDRFLATLVHGEPTLYFLHIQLPHVPWRFFPDGTTYEMPYAKADFEFTNRGGDGWVGRAKEFRFLMQMQYTDALVGKIFARLEERGLFDESLIIVTSDHGRSFKPTGPIRALLPTTVDAVAYAPLLVKRPGQQAGNVSDANIMAYDVLPTIADALGIALPWEVVGLAANDPGIALRGDEKLAFFRGKESPVGEEYRFSDADNFPRFSGRGIGVHREGVAPLALLNQHLELDEYLGRPVSDFDSAPGGTAQVMRLDDLQRPDSDKPVAAVMGHVDSPTDASHVLVAVDDRFVSGSPLMLYREVEQSFYALLPQAAVRKDKALSLYLVSDTLQKLALENAR